MEFADYFSIWPRLTPEQQDRLSAAMTRHTAKGGDILHDGAGCTGLMLIRSGRFRVFILSPQGREITLYRLFERDLCLFSASCILQSIQFDVTIQAETDADYWLIPPEVYHAVMEDSAPLANYTNEIMASRFSEVMWLMEQVVWGSMDRRIAAFLLEESAIEGGDALHLTHEIIANHLGTHREVVTRMLRYFQSEGLVHLRRGAVELTGRPGLEALAGK